MEFSKQNLSVCQLILKQSLDILFMRANSIRQQFFSSVNPDQLYQTPFNHNVALKMNENLPRKNSYLKESRKSAQRSKYLTVVSKPKKMGKNIQPKNNKKIFANKNKSVILGGNKKSLNTSPNSDTKQRSQLCKSCICEYRQQPNKKTSFFNTQNRPVQIYQSSPVKINPISFTYQQPLTQQQNQNVQLNRIVYHKLNLASFQPHESFLNNVKFNTSGRSVASSFGSKLRRRPISSGKIYSSIPNVNNQNPINDQKPFLTPRFDKANTEPRKNKRNAGFIRSCSVKKQRNDHYDSVPVQPSFNVTTQFDLKYTSQNERKLSIQSQRSHRLNFKGQYQINECFQKMTSIKKQINDLQNLLSYRLSLADQRSKSMTKLPVKPQNLALRNVMPQIYKFENNLDFNQTIQLANSKTNTLVSKLKNTCSNELKVSTIYSSVSSSKDYNLQDKSYQSRSNANCCDKFDEIYRLKCPTNQCQKQIICQIGQKSLVKKLQIQNQQNFTFKSVSPNNKRQINPNNELIKHTQAQNLESTRKFGQLFNNIR